MYIPEMISVRDLQRNYKKTVDRVRDAGNPVVVLRNNKPEVAIVNIKKWQDQIERIEKLEEQLALQDIAQSEKEYQEGKAKKLNGSLLDLIE